MLIALFQRLFAFFDNIWSFILTLVRSLLALFSFRRRSSDPFALPRVNRTPKEALTRAHTRLRPILLTPRAVAGHHPQRAPSTRTPSASSTLFQGLDQHASTSGSAPPTAPQRTSPKLDPHDPELGLSSSNTPTASDHTGPSVANATSFGEGTADASSLTTPIGSLYVLPLTPPDRCYLAPMPASATDCPYVDPPAVVGGKPRLPGSPLKVSIHADPVSTYAEAMIRPSIGSPPPRHWSPPQIWTSTPFKTANREMDMLPDPVLHESHSSMDPAMLGVAHALLSRSQGCLIQAYDDSNHTMSPSDVHAHPLGDALHRDRYAIQIPARARHDVTQVAYEPQYHADPYVCTWRRHTRLPGKASHYPRSRSHTDLATRGWYEAEAYVPSPNPALSPPLPPSPPVSEDDDEPLGRLKARLAHRRTAMSTSIGYGLPDTDADEASPRTRRRRSEGCLLAMLSSSPTPIGLGAWVQRDADGYTKDWLEALSLHAPEAGPF